MSTFLHPLAVKNKDCWKDLPWFTLTTWTLIRYNDKEF